MKLDDLRHLPVEPLPINEPLSHNIYTPFEIAIIKLKKNNFAEPNIVVGIHERDGSYTLMYSHRIVRGFVESPDFMGLEDIESYEPQKRF